MPLKSHPVPPVRIGSSGAKIRKASGLFSRLRQSSLRLQNALHHRCRCFGCSRRSASRRTQTPSPATPSTPTTPNLPTLFVATSNGIAAQTSATPRSTCRSHWRITPLTSWSFNSTATISTSRMGLTSNLAPTTSQLPSDAHSNSGLRPRAMSQRATGTRRANSLTVAPSRRRGRLATQPVRGALR